VALIWLSHITLRWGLTVASIYDLKLLFEAPLSFRAVNNIPTHPGEVAVIFVVPILVTNLLSTSFIAWKAWYVVWFPVCSRPLSWQMSSNPRDYHRTVGPHIRKGRTPGHVEKVLMLLIETDIVYCIFWVFSFCPLSMDQSSTLNDMCCRWFTYWPRSEYFPA
jgi:hypothetical protein